MEQTERDILIEVKTKVELLTTTVNSLSLKLDTNSDAYDKLRSDIDTMKPQMDENNRFRWTATGGLITGSLGLASSILLYFIK